MSIRKLCEFARIVGGAVLLSVFIMAFVVRAFTVNGPSMMPTLHSGERLLVDKLTYHLRPPQRGEVVVFRYPGNPKQFYIKRVIAVPGDTLIINHGRVLINGVALDEPYVGVAAFDAFGPSTIPQGHVFVMGDNRGNSEDSRDQRVGFIPYPMVIGRALWRYWPLTRAGSLTEPSSLAQASSWL